MDISPWDYPKFYEYDHYRPVAESGALMLARAEEDMPALISEALERPDAWKAPQAELMRRMFGGLLDGLSASRVAETLVRLASARATSRGREAIPAHA
jgi:hypothetical protein